jgi:S-adenosylmethionine synthetase
MFGFACNETKELMPIPIHLSHRLVERMTDLRKDGTIPWLRPDSKSQVSVAYQDGKPTLVTKVVIATQHDDMLDQFDTEKAEHDFVESEMINKVIIPVLNECGLSYENDFIVNGTGRFVFGGPEADTGLTGRKIIVDTYGGYAPHGGGAFSGKDPSKVDRSAAYAARYVAKNIVASKIANKCLIQLAYAIGVSKPLSIYVDLFDRDEEKSKYVEKLVKDNFDLSPRGIREMLKLNKPIYECTAAYGHFGRKPGSDGSFSWEKTDKMSIFKK